MMEMMRELGQNRAKVGLLGIVVLSGLFNLNLPFSARESFGILTRIKYYDNETGEDTIHIVEESPIMFYATYVVPKSSPFISAYNIVIHFAREAGLIDHLIKAAFYRSELKRMDRYRKGLIKSKKRQVIRTQQLTDIFYFFLLCIILCSVVFILEIFTHKIQQLSRKKHSNLRKERFETKITFKL